ncbi:sugar transferase [Lentibacter algarum]|uniref:sugar transferase n=1 Tax=Lentibacter algarum TaxID=576131 RepID=UPI003AF84D04
MLKHAATFPRRDRIFDVAKRAMDLAGATVGLVGSAPVMLAAALAVRATMGSPVLFAQDRPGKDGAPFRLRKFRTMRHACEGIVEEDEERLTALGRLLRATSVDELPTFINVLRGEMSLVGPRPLLMRYLSRYTKHQYRRHEVRPGITGLAQVRGRNRLSWEEKFDLDVEYVQRRSLVLDARILIETLLKVVKRDGISQAGHATMPEFTGSAEGV